MNNASVIKYNRKVITISKIFINARIRHISCNFIKHNFIKHLLARPACKNSYTQVTKPRSYKKKCFIRKYGLLPLLLQKISEPVNFLGYHHGMHFLYKKKQVEILKEFKYFDIYHTEFEGTISEIFVIWIFVLVMDL